MNIVENLPLFMVSNIADYHARAALRHGRQNPGGEGFAVHQNRMYDVLETSKYPRLAAIAVVRHIGRGKAMVLKIDRDIINLAL